MNEDPPELEVSEPIQPEPSLRDSIKSAFEETQNPAPDAPITEAPKDEKPRDGGPKDGEKRETLTLKKPGSAAPAAAIAPPMGWKDSAKAKFSTLDPEVQAEIVRRETEAHRKITANDDERTFGKRIRELGRPYEATMAMAGADHEKSYQNYLNTAHILMTGSPQLKMQALHAIAKQYNIDLGVPLPQGPADPTIAALQREVADLRQGRQAEIQQRQQQENTALQAELDAFLAAPGHDHFEAVKPVMAALLQSGQAQNYQEAYEKATWADPEIRSSLVTAKAKEDEDKRKADLTAKADAAKRAAVSVTGSPGGVKPSTGNGTKDRSLRDELRANLRAAQGRI